ncbi:MAG TPA: hypothetical protein VGC00_03120 [Thermoanaerobaculia bacterium]
MDRSTFRALPSSRRSLTSFATFFAPGKDAHDIALILGCYAEAGNSERRFDEIPGIGEREDFDFEMAGAELCGRDLAKVVSADLNTELTRILRQEANPRGDLRLAGEMDREDPEGARETLDAFLRGLRPMEVSIE